MSRLDITTTMTGIARQHCWLWDDLAASGATGDPEAFWLEVLTPYLEEGRFYHSLTHISDGLHELADVRSLLKRPALAGLAWVCHDIRYDVERHDNEELSAEYCRSLALRLGLSSKDTQLSGSMVEATARHESEDPDTQFLLDTDLAILGYPLERFLAYEEGVRKEYSRKYSPQEFAAGRLDWIATFLKTHAERVYYTDSFEQRYGQQAIDNLRSSLVRLQ